MTTVTQETRTRLLTDRKIRTLNRARDILMEVVAESRLRSWQHDDPFGCGFTAGQAKAAADAIFQALNAARAYLDEPITDDLLYNREQGGQR